MDNTDFLNYLETSMRQAKSYQKTVEWIELHIGKGLRFGTDVEDECGRIVFSMKDTPAKSPQRLLACLLMQILTADRQLVELLTPYGQH